MGKTFILLIDSKFVIKKREISFTIFLNLLLKREENKILASDWLKIPFLNLKKNLKKKKGNLIC